MYVPIQPSRTPCPRKRLEAFRIPTVYCELGGHKN